MPLASGSAPQTYRWALGLGILIPVVAGALGFLAFAFVAAAVVVPAIYVVYMYDVNQWEDQPIGVVLGADRGRRRARRRLHLPLARRDPRQQRLVGELRRQRRRRGALDEPAGPGAAGPGRRRGAQAGRAAGAGEPAAVRRHDRRADLRCRRGRGLRRRRDDRGQPRALQQLRPGRLAERRLLGLAHPLGRRGQADRLRRGHRHRRGQLLRPGRRLRRLQARLLPRPGRGAASPTSSSRAGCSSPPGSRAPRAPWSVWSGARSSRLALVVRLRYLLHFAVLEAALEAASTGGGAEGQRPRHGVLPLVRDAAPDRRELLRRVRHVGARRQQGRPGSATGVDDDALPRGRRR